MKHTVRNFLIGVVLLLAASVAGFGQQQSVVQPDCQFGFTFTATGSSAAFDNRSAACTTWTVVYNNAGFSALSIELDSAPDSSGQPGTFVTWPNLASGAQPLTATTNGTITGYKYQPWVSVKVNSVTGAGTIRGTAFGWRPFAGQDANSTAAAASSPSATGASGVGCTPSHLLSAATTNATSLKGSAGQLYSVVATNTNTAPRYLKLSDSASAPTCGTTPVVQTYLLPGNTTGAGIVLPIPVGMSFTSGISYCITGGIADNDTTAVAANEVVVNTCHK